MQNVVSEYINPRIGVLGSHSALEIMDGAKMKNLKQLYFVKKGERFLIKDLVELQTKLRL